MLELFIPGASCSCRKPGVTDTRLLQAPGSEVYWGRFGEVGLAPLGFGGTSAGRELMIEGPKKS